MTQAEAIANMKKQIEAAQEKFRKKAEGVHGEAFKAVTKGCLIIEETVKKKMTDTVTNPDVTYGRGHHPSMPGYAPAPDSGTLRDSVAHVVEEENGKITGRTGSTIIDPPYPVWLEEGTSRMAPRPVWLPSLDENRNRINSLLEDAVAGRPISMEVEV